MTDEPHNSKPETTNPEEFLTPGRFAVVLALLLAVTFWRVLFGGEAFFYRDYGFLGYPFAHFHRECFWSGDFFPLWNPYVNCGAPFLAQWNTLCLYPGSLIYLLLPLPWSLGFFCVVHLFLGGMGMRALAERWTGSAFGAGVGGVAFVFSGLVLGCVIYPNYLVALGWMPWVVLAVRRAWQEGGRRLVIAALVGAMQMLTGAPEIILLTWGFLAMLLVVDIRGLRAACCVLGDASSGRPAEITQHATRNTVSRFFSVIALITGLCAAQLLPFFQLLALSQRSGDAVNTFWSLPGWGWVNLFFPLFMNFQTEQGVFVMIGQSFFPSVYLGIVPLTLAGLAVWRIGLRREAGVKRVEAGGELVAALPPHPGPLPPGEGERQSALGNAAAPSPAVVWEVRLLAGATLVAVLLAMGDNFILWHWLRGVLPLGIMRFPVKMLLLGGFTVPLLAAWGVSLLEHIASEHKGRDQRTPDDASDCLDTFLERVGRMNSVAKMAPVFAAIILVALLVFGQARWWPVPLAGMPKEAVGLLAHFNLWTISMLVLSIALISLVPRRRTLAAGALLILLGWSGVTSNEVLRSTIPAAAFEPGLAAAYHASKGALTPAPKLGESRIMLSPQAERALHTRMVPKFYDDFIGQRLAFWGNLNLLDGLPKVNGASTLVTREWNDVEYFLYGTTNPAPANLMDFLGVTHTTKAGELMQWERRETAMPLVSAGQTIQTYDNGSQSVGALLGENWNPRETVLISAGASTSRVDRAAATVRVRRFQPRASGMQPASVSDDSNGRRLQAAGTDAGATGMIEVEAEAAAPTVLVLAQNFYPGWRATVNGQPAPVLRANHAFQAIAIPAGKSTIQLDYVDWPFRFGVGISLLTLAGCGVLWRRSSPT